ARSSSHVFVRSARAFALRRNENGLLLGVSRYDPRLEAEDIWIARVDSSPHPVSVARTERLEPSEVAQHAAARRVIEWFVQLEVVRVAVNEYHLTAERLGHTAQLIDVVRVGVEVVRIRQVLFVVEVGIRLPDDHHAFRTDSVGVREPGLEPPEIRRLASHLLISLPLNLGIAPDRHASTGFGVAIREVVVRALDVEAQVDDRPELPALILGIAFDGLTSELERVLAEALVGREEQAALEVQALLGVGKRLRRRTVASPAVSPVVVARHEDERAFQTVEVVQRREVERVRTRTVAAGLQIAVVDRE